MNEIKTTEIKYKSITSVNELKKYVGKPLVFGYNEGRFEWVGVFKEIYADTNFSSENFPNRTVVVMTHVMYLKNGNSIKPNLMVYYYQPLTLNATTTAQSYIRPLNREEMLKFMQTINKIKVTGIKKELTFTCVSSTEWSSKILGLKKLT